MKKIFSVILLVFSISLTSSQWVQQTSGTTQNLTDVLIFPSSQTGVTVGYTSLVLKTTNNGTNWVSVTNPGTQYLYDVCYAGGTTAYSSGYTRIIKTTNSGTNWTNTGSVPAKIYSGIYFFNESTGWACGHCDTILKTTNGGTNWIIYSNNLFSTENSTDIQFVNIAVGYVSGFYDSGGYILRTINGGANWVTLLTVPGNSLRCINMIDGSTGFAGGSQTIHKTTNGGVNWTSYSLPGAQGVHKIIFPADGQTGFAVTESGRIYKTTNAGVNWNYLTNPIATPLYSIGFAPNSNTTGYAVGSAGVILRTTNGGGSFTAINSNGTEIPDKFSLSQNYPNPFNPTTQIKFNIPANEHVRISVYDILGNEISVLNDTDMKPGEYSVTWNAAGYSSGIYFCKMKAGSFTETRKMSLIK